MGDKGLDFRHKEVINIKDGKRLGYVQDVCADLETGIITSIIVPGGNNKLLNIFNSTNDIIIPWQSSNLSLLLLSPTRNFPSSMRQFYLPDQR